MLSYLDQLCSALLARNEIEVYRLLKHPLARALPRPVREEALAIARGKASGMRAPIHALRFYHQTAQLLLEEPESVLTGPQLELALEPAPGSYEIDVTIARASRLPAPRPVKRAN
ncbi:MAG TPA: hypothetical protein VJ596_04865 [Gemmatimonadaceae bacterium]|nr:hypothetical protein [Gemmatimonadaceae bacterium]